MDANVQGLIDNLQSEDDSAAKQAAVKLAQIGQPERIEPAVEALQARVRAGPNRVGAAALSALARYGDAVDQQVVADIEHHLSAYLNAGRYNQQNALIAISVTGNDSFRDPVQRLTGDDETVTAAAATLTLVRLSGDDLEWLPIDSSHVRWIVSDGLDGLLYVEPVYGLYVMDGYADEGGQRISARDKLLGYDLDRDVAESMVRFLNDYPSSRVSSHHIGLLSNLAEDYPQLVVDALESPADSLRNSSGQKRRQYLWTFANIAEQRPDALSTDVIELAEEIAEIGSAKQVVQAERILTAIEERDATEHEQGIENEGSAELLARAREAAEEEPVREQITSTGSRYHRSTPIKEYAKDRADGVCECCGEPAPFEDASGEPYLEVHHVDELGEGGADTPERVVAICPTCHREIHYGAEGEELNEQLKATLSTKFGGEQD